jgi:hypothetical protein
MSVPSTTYSFTSIDGMSIRAIASPFSGCLRITRLGGSKKAVFSFSWCWFAT